MTSEIRARGARDILPAGAPRLGLGCGDLYAGAAEAASLRLLLRHRYYLPRRLTHRIGLIDTCFAPRTARKMDAQTAGEAILAEFG